MVNNYKQKRNTRQGIFKILMLMLLLGAANILQAQVSVTATSGNTSPTSYTTVNAAFAAINAGTHQGAITITVTANTTEPTFLAANQLLASGVGSSSYTSILIKPQGNVMVNSAAAPTASRGMLEFIGADNITIDGDDPLTPGVRNLTFQMATSSSVTAVLRFSSSATASNGCLNTVVKNCNIIGSRHTTTTTTNTFGIFSGLASATATVTTISGAADNDNMLLENNNIQRCYYGIYTYGLSSYEHDNLIIRNNVIGTNVMTNMVGLRGISTAFTQVTPSASSLIIEGNDIRLGDTLAGWSANVSAIDLGTTNAGAIIRNNHIHDVRQPSTNGFGAYGIFLSSATANNGVSIYNNIIRNIRTYPYQNSTTSAFQPIGIFAGSSGITDLRINHNTILMPQQFVTNTTYSSHGVLLVSGVVLSQFNNNSIHNQHTSSAGYAFTSNAIANISNASMDRNNYFVQGANIGYVNGAARATLAAWKLASAKDTNSVSVLPPYISATNLHLQAGVKSALESNGRVTSVTTDIDGNVRPGPAGSIYGGASAPDIGAHEADMLPDLLVPDSVNATQVVQTIAPGDTSRAIMNIKVYLSGSIGSPINLNALTLNTIGTTTNSDITAAKVFYTGSSNVFSTNDLYGSVSAPSGSYIVSGTKALGAGVHNFWVAYDISASALSGNSADVRLDSINMSGVYLKPLNGNPAGVVSISNPMTYVSSTTTQALTSKVEQGSTNNQIIRVEVSMSAIGSAVSLTELNINLNGTTDTADLQNIKVWYTGTSNTFATTNQFGTTVANAPTTFSPYAMAITGNQSLVNGSNYFWVTYDIKGTAVLSNVVDAECTGITVAGTPQVPSITAPVGNREIRAPYCIPTLTNGCGIDYVSQVTMLGGVANINNLTGCNGNPNGYINYSNITGSAMIGGTFTIQLMAGGDTEGLAVWIDFNGDGVFSANEFVFSAPPSIDVLQTGSITIPRTAIAGLTRMRVRAMYSYTMGSGDACLSATYGETEDYNFIILPEPTPTAYVWNQTTPGSYVTPSNWTPARTTTNLNDILVFNGGGNVTVNNTITQTVSKLVVSNNTVVTLNGTADLTVADTLDLVSGRLNSGASVNPILGSSITNTGYLQGTGKVEGKLTRWFSATTGTYVFPLSKGIDSRSASITYSTAPTTAGKLEVRYITGAPGINGLPIIDGALTLDSISKDGIWRATASSGLAGGIFDIVVNADNIPGVNNFATTALVARADNSSAWFAVGTQVTTTGSNTAMVLSRTGLNAFGEVGIAGTLINPLPVKLINLNATTNGSDVLVSWTTASEVNNRGFNVERSIDGKTFEYVGFVKGAGNSSVTNNYRLQDANAFVSTGVSKLYYRLKQMDSDGKFEYSNIISLANDELNVVNVEAYPNPFGDKLTIAVQGVQAGNVHVDIVDISGRVMLSLEKSIVNGNNSLIIDEASLLSQGVYFVKVNTDGVTKVIKMIKQ